MGHPLQRLKEASDLMNGMIVTTYGYYVIGGGGGADDVIKRSSEMEGGGSVIALSKRYLTDCRRICCRWAAS